MKVGILEIMPQGHYTLIDSVVRIFVSDPANEFRIFTHSGAAKILSPLISEFQGRIDVIVEDNDWYDLFCSINREKVDRLYIITLDRYFKQISKFEFNCPLFIVIHNIDLWFQAGSRYLVYSIGNNISTFRKLVYALKVYILYSFWRKKVRDKVVVTRGKFVVLSEAVKNELEKYVDKGSIEVLPFSVYNRNLEKYSSKNQLLRICIPGIISDVRRDYFSFFSILEDELLKFKGTVEIDLLGSVSREESGGEIINRAKRLEEQGLIIHYYSESFISIEEYDMQLAKADLILGNMRVVLDKYSKYGMTKETGIVFCMIRAAKPGLLPAEYPVIDELKNSTIVYKDYEEVKNIMKTFVDDKSKLNKLKENALNNSLLFEPQYVYEKIMGVKK